MNFLRYPLLGLSLFYPIHSAYADEEDTRFLLNTARQQSQQQEQNNGWQNASINNQHQITINGQTYRVGESEEELALGLYYAINLQQWDKVNEFLSQYQRLSDHKPELILLAQGLLARARNDHRTALDKLQKTNTIAPNDARIQLELGRLYTEDYQHKEAIQQFKEATNNPTLPNETRKIVQSYIDAAQERNDWHGSLSIGRGYNNNINQANGAELCALQVVDMCFITQSLPKPVSSAFLNYQLSFSKQIPLKGNHHLLIRPLVYGNHYDKKDKVNPPLQDYSDNTSLIHFGYQYKTAKNEVNFSPYFEHYYRDGRSQYTALGLEISWEHSLSPDWKINTQANIKRYHYSSAAKQYYSDYTQSSLGTGLTYRFSPLASVYAGLDITRRKYPWTASSSKEYGTRIGAFKYFESGFYINALAIYKDHRFDDNTFLSHQARRDKQKIVIAAIGAPKWNVKNIYPEIRLKRIVNNSNLIFYKFKQNEISLNFKYNF